MPLNQLMAQSVSLDQKESKEKKLHDIDNNSNFEDEEIIKLTGRLVKDTIPINPEEKKKKKSFKKSKISFIK